MFLADYQTEKLMEDYKKDAMEVIGNNVSKKAVNSFSKFLCDFYLEDEAQKLMEILNLKEIHIAALEENTRLFNKCLDKEKSDYYESLL